MDTFDNPRNEVSGLRNWHRAVASVAGRPAERPHHHLAHNAVVGTGVTLDTGVTVDCSRRPLMRS